MWTLGEDSNDCVVSFCMQDLKRMSSGTDLTENGDMKLKVLEGSTGCAVGFFGTDMTTERVQGSRREDVVNAKRALQVMSESQTPLETALGEVGIITVKAHAAEPRKIQVGQQGVFAEEILVWSADAQRGRARQSPGLPSRASRNCRWRRSRRGPRTSSASGSRTA